MGKSTIPANLTPAKAGAGSLMPRPRAGEMNVQYSVKEILSRIELDIKAIMAMMHMKAERAELEGLKTRVDLIEKRGSDKAQEAEEKVERLETVVDKLRQDTSFSENIQKNKDAWEKSRSDTKWLIIGLVINALIALASGAVAIQALKPH